jgi:hypothetical protein
MKGKTKLFLFLAAVAVAVVFLAKTYMGAESPSSVKLTVYKVELMTGALDANPQVVFSNSSGQEMDLTKDAGAVVVGERVVPGTYKRIRMTVAGGVKLSVKSAADNPCGDGAFTDRIFPIAEGADPNPMVEISFAANDDRGGTWKDGRITHMLLRPIEVNGGRTELKLKFNTADTLFCSSGAVKVLAPWSVWAGTL